MSRETLNWGFAISAACLASLYLAVPRPLEPQGMPALSVSPGDISQVMRKDAQHATGFPRTKALESLRTLMAEQAVAEMQGSVSTPYARSLKKRLYRIRGAFSAASSSLSMEHAKYLSSLFMHDYDQQMLRGDLKDVPFAGSLPRVAKRYGLTSYRSRTSRFVLRTWYRARLNHLWGRIAEDGFSNTEKLAFNGWLALRANQAPKAQKVRALHAYAKLGGPRAKEALSILATQSQDWSEAQDLLTQITTSFNWRLRNYRAYITARDQGF